MQSSKITNVLKPNIFQSKDYLWEALMFKVKKNLVKSSLLPRYHHFIDESKVTKAVNLKWQQLKWLVQEHDNKK